MRRFIPSPSMVVAVAAVVLAVARTAPAAALISGARLKNRSVSAKKIKVNSLTSKEVAETKLKTVRRSKFANVALGAFSVGGLQARRIYATQAPGASATDVLDMQGFQLLASCSGGNPQLRARTAVNDAELRGSVVGTPTNNANPMTPTIAVPNFDISGTPSLTGGKQRGQGTVVYRRPDNRMASVTYSFSDVGGCRFTGTSLGGWRCPRAPRPGAGCAGPSGGSPRRPPARARRGRRGPPGGSPPPASGRSARRGRSRRSPPARRAARGGATWRGRRRGRAPWGSPTARGSRRRRARVPTGSTRPS